MVNNNVVDTDASRVLYGNYIMYDTSTGQQREAVQWVNNSWSQ